MPDPETRHTETLDFDARWIEAQTIHYEDKPDRDRLRLAAQCVRDVATLRALVEKYAEAADRERAEVERLRPYEAFVQAIDRGTVRVIDRLDTSALSIRVWKTNDENPFAYAAPDALSAWAKARGTE